MAIPDPSPVPRRFFGLMKCWAIEAGAPRHNAADIVQDVLVKLIARTGIPAGLDTEEGRFAAWLKCVVCNAVRDDKRYRERGKRSEARTCSLDAAGVGAEPLADGTRPSVAAAKNELQAALLLALPRAEREVCELFLVHGLSDRAEIARRLNIRVEEAEILLGGGLQAVGKALRGAQGETIMDQAVDGQSSEDRRKLGSIILSGVKDRSEGGVSRDRSRGLLG